MPSHTSGFRDETMDKQLTVLFVDDEQNILDSINRLYHSAPWRIVTAKSGRDGIECLQNETIDIVVSDLYMPGMSGVDFLRIVRNRWPEVIRITLTGNINDEAMKTAIQSCDIFRYISKPWQPHELEAAIEEAAQEININRSALEGDSRNRPTFTLRIIDEIKGRLMEEGLLDIDQLCLATDIAKTSGDSLGNILVRLNYIKEEDLLDFISRHMDLPRVRLSEQEMDHEVLDLVPSDLAWRYQMIPLRRSGSHLVVAITDAADLMIADEIKALYGLEIEPVICSEVEIH
ncbi:MAG: response regulator [bacterium]|nr:response regulator [bacterium]